MTDGATRQWRGQRVGAAALFGIAFVSLAMLLLNVRIAPVSILMGALLFPGGVLAGICFGTSHPIVILAFNALIYSAFAYLAILSRYRNSTASQMKHVMVGLAPAAAILLSLACVPSINPLWPRGMEDLAKQEQDLQQALPLGMSLENARAVLRTRGILFDESREQPFGMSFGNGDDMTMGFGEEVVWAQFPTHASQFPCSYDIQIVLLFGTDHRVRQRHVKRFPVC